MEMLAGIVLVVLGVAGLLVLASLWSGYVLSVLWGWFCVPLFGLPPLPVAGAIGLSLIIHFTTHQYIDTQESDADGSTKLIKALSQIVIGPAAALGIGWVAKQWLT